MSENQHTTGEQSRHEFKVVASETLLEAPIICVRRDQVVMPGGAVHAREVVEHFGAVAIVVIRPTEQASTEQASTEQTNTHPANTPPETTHTWEVAVVHQWRQSVGRRLYELPAGLLDVYGEDPLVCAQRELREEAGVHADTWHTLVDLVNSPGFCDEAVRVYLAKDLHEIDRPEPEEEEADLVLKWLPLEQACDMVFSGEIVNSIAVGGLLAAARALTQHSAGHTALRPADCPFELRPTRLPERRAHLADMKRLP